jgi:hypothetical protein
MTKPARLFNASILLVQAIRVANAAAMLFFVAILVATLPGAGFVQVALIRKYRGTVDPATVVLFIQTVMLLSLPVGVAIERLLVALRAILRTVQDKEPFVRANAARLRMIGWMLLIVQLADLAYGVTTIVANRLHIQDLVWQPGFTGWVAVLIAFVLAQVFEHGAAMRDDLDGTV